MPPIRGKISAHERKIGHFDDAPEVLEFVNSHALGDLAPLGTSCPDHFLRTKIRPLVLPFDPERDDLDAVARRARRALEAYRADYAAYYERCKHANSPAMRDPNAVIYLVPGVGMFTFAKDKATARIASEFYVNAINVMRGASGVGGYVGLPEQEAFDIEYWLLEEAKLQRMPKPKSLAGRIALITGGAGGIGRATAARLLGEGACVVLADIDQTALDERGRRLRQDLRQGRRARRAARRHRRGRRWPRAFRRGALEFGGLDILVSNAGIASAAPIEDTTLAMWQKNIDILVDRLFPGLARGVPAVGAAGAAAAILSSSPRRTGLPPRAGASAYCAAKAAEIHLARCLALEGAPHGIRVNMVNPDAVLRGSKIWEGEWRQQRAPPTRSARTSSRRSTASARC